MRCKSDPTPTLQRETLAMRSPSRIKKRENKTNTKKDSKAQFSSLISKVILTNKS